MAIDLLANESSELDKAPLGLKPLALHEQLVSCIRKKRETQFQTLCRLLAYTKPHRGLLTALVTLGVLGLALAFVFPWLIGSLLDIVVAPRGTPLPWPQRARWLFFLIGASLVTAMLHALIAYGRGHCTVLLGNRIVMQLRCDLFEHLQKLSLQFYHKEQSGSIASRLLHDVHAATSVIYGGLIVVGLDVLQLAMGLGLVVMVNYKLALGAAVIFPLYALSFRHFNPKVREVSERLNNHYSKLSGVVQEQLAGAALIKSYATEQREADRFGTHVREHHRYEITQSHMGHLAAGAGEVLIHLGTALVIGYGGWLALRGELTAGELTKVLGYVGVMYGPVRRFAELNILYQTSLSALRRVFRVFKITPAITEKRNAIPRAPRYGVVRFENIRFRYEIDNDESKIRLDRDSSLPPEYPTNPSNVMEIPTRWVLDGVSFEAAPGERVALVGPSGAGKTTIAWLLQRMYDVSQGRILIDGQDIRDYSLKPLRSSIGVVQQDSFVFSGTVRDNIAYGRPDAGDDEIIAAAKAANAHEFIVSLPDGYQTYLGERGVNLSGGQRQRVSIARAILTNPRILILDEATSALDAQSEALVQSALERVMRGRTCLIIAHRLSTVRAADRILVLKSGHIVESGSHETLLAQGGFYAGLIRTQFVGGQTRTDPVLDYAS